MTAPAMAARWRTIFKCIVIKSSYISFRYRPGRSAFTTLLHSMTVRSSRTTDSLTTPNANSSSKHYKAEHSILLTFIHHVFMKDFISGYASFHFENTFHLWYIIACFVFVKIVIRDGKLTHMSNQYFLRNCQSWLKLFWFTIFYTIYI